MVFNLPTANIKKNLMDIESDEDDNSNIYDKSQIFKARCKVNRQKPVATQLTDFSTLSLDRIL